MARPKRQRNMSVTEEVETALETSSVSTPDTKIEEEPPKKKQKYAKTKVANRRSKKTGIDVEESSSLSGMCEDVLVEIFAQLTPLDLLHLSWTSKSLHNILTTESLAWVWKKTRTENILEGIPECPNDLKEPQYANFMFRQHCFYCRKEPDVIEVKTIWSGRIRACIGCLKKKTLFAFEIGKDKDDWMNGYPRELLRHHLPQISMPFGRNSRRNYYHLETHELWKQEYKEAKNKSQWLKAKITEQEAIAEHAYECETWIENWNVSMVDERKQIVLDRLKELGWGKELDRITKSCDGPLETEIVNKACEGRLTETDLLNMEPFLNEFMESVRVQRRVRYRRINLQWRIPVLVDVIKSCKLNLPPNTPAPDVGDLFRLPLVLDIINTKPNLKFKEEHLDPLREAYPEIARQWKLDKETELVGIIKSACGENYIFNPDAVLHLATTMFSCGICGVSGKPVWHPRILLHEHAIVSLPSDPDTDTKTMYNETKTAHWNAANRIGFMKNEMSILSNVLTQFGFDPKVITAAEMNAVDPIFECVTCSSPRKGRFTMKWTFVAHHIFHSHPPTESSSGSYKLEMFQGREVQSIRDRFAEDNARDRADITYLVSKKTICVHCREMDDSVKIAEHIWTKHGIADPTDADMVPNLDVPFIDMRYSWPPRKEERHPVPVR